MTVDTIRRVPNRIAELRLKQKLTQPELAKLAGVSPSAVAKHEAGDRTPEAETILAYAKVFKVETYEIFISPDELGNNGPLEND